MDFISLWEIIEPAVNNTIKSKPVPKQQPAAPDNQFVAFWSREEHEVRQECAISSISKELHNAFINASDAPAIVERNIKGLILPSDPQTKEKFFSILRDLADYAHEKQKARLEHLTVCQVEGRDPLDVPIGGNLRPIRAALAAREIGFYNNPDLAAFLNKHGIKHTLTTTEPPAAPLLEDKLFRGKEEIILAFKTHGRPVQWTQIRTYRKEQGLQIVYDGRTPTLRLSELWRFLGP